MGEGRSCLSLVRTLNWQMDFYIIAMQAWLLQKNANLLVSNKPHYLALPVLQPEITVCSWNCTSKITMDND